MIQVAVANEQADFPVDESLLRRAVKHVLRAHDRENATISVAVVDNPAIHDLNNRFLQHDYPTDVLSFVLDDGPAGLDGEVIVSAEMAVEQAQRFQWPPKAELLLYVVHGTLHLVGYDDLNDEAAREMRRAEAAALAEFGWQVPDSRPDLSGEESPDE
jgi:probable rRNA maturation factor